MTTAPDAPFWILELFTRGGGPSFNRYYAGFSLADVNTTRRGTDDINQAKRFPSKQDAEAAAGRMNERLCSVEWRAAEHGFVRPLATPDELVRMVLDDMSVCYDECGVDYQFKELSTETVEALDAYRAARR